MAKQLRKKALLICLGSVFLAAIGVFPRSFARAKQNRTNLHIEVTGLKSVNGRDQAAGVAGAKVLVKALAADQEFEETSATNSQGVASVADVPYGTTLIQVTAQGWKNSGNRYELNKRDQTIKVQLKEAEEAAPSPSPTPSGSPLCSSCTASSSGNAGALARYEDEARNSFSARSLRLSVLRTLCGRGRARSQY